MVPYSNGELAQMEQAGKNAEHCVCCGAIIPEGRQVCLICELNVKNKCNLVERKKGHWDMVQRGRWIYAKCSECGNVSNTQTPYCCYCGADMREEKTDGNP